MHSINKGDVAEIVAINHGEPAYRAKLLALGLLPGTQFKVIRKAPLGDPVEILVRGYRLSLRKKEAAMLQIKQVNTWK